MCLETLKKRNTEAARKKMGHHRIRTRENRRSGPDRAFRPGLRRLDRGAVGRDRESSSSEMEMEMLLIIAVGFSSPLIQENKSSITQSGQQNPPDSTGFMVRVYIPFHLCRKIVSLASLSSRVCYSALVLC